MFRGLTTAGTARAFLLTVALAFVASCGGSSPTAPPQVPTPPPQQPPPPPPDPPAVVPPTLGVTRILTFGDSMTEGVDQPPLPGALTALTFDPGRSQSYPYKLKGLADARYTSQTITIHNGGIAGRQARDDRERFGRALRDSNPEVVLLMEGANDLNAPLTAGEGINARVTSTVDALEDMVRDATGRGITVFIATLPPQRPGGPKAGGVEALPRFNDTVRSMAAKKGATLVDVHGQMSLSHIGLDGLHPTEAGYQRIAEIWLEALKARYEKTPQ